VPEKPGDEFELQIETLLNSLTQDLSIWRELTQKYKVDILCGVWIRNWNRGMGLSPRLMAKLAERGLYLGLDIYAELEGDDG